MWTEISRLSREEGLTILLTTHYLEEADQLASQLAIIDRGAVVAEGTPEGLKGELEGEAIHVELREGVNGRGPAALEGVAGVREVQVDGRVAPRPRRRRRDRRAGGARRARRRATSGGLGDRLAAVAGRCLPALRGPRLSPRAPTQRDNDKQGGLLMPVALRHGYYMMERELLALWRQPWWIAITLMQPIIWLLLFGAMFERITDIPGFTSNDYIQFLTPGVVVMTAFFSATWSGMGMIQDLDRGVTDRLLVSPVARPALIAGKVMQQSVVILIQTAIMIGLRSRSAARSPAAPAACWSWSACRSCSAPPWPRSRTGSACWSARRRR